MGDLVKRLAKEHKNPVDKARLDRFTSKSKKVIDKAYDEGKVYTHGIMGAHKLRRSE